MCSRYLLCGPHTFFDFYFPLMITQSSSSSFNNHPSQNKTIIFIFFLLTTLNDLYFSWVVINNFLDVFIIFMFLVFFILVISQLFYFAKMNNNFPWRNIVKVGAWSKGSPSLVLFSDSRQMVNLYIKSKSMRQRYKTYINTWHCFNKKLYVCYKTVLKKTLTLLRPIKGYE